MSRHAPAVSPTNDAHALRWLKDQHEAPCGAADCDSVYCYIAKRLEAVPAPTLHDSDFQRLVIALIDAAKEETRDLLQLGSPDRVVRDKRTAAENAVYEAFAAKGGARILFRSEVTDETNLRAGNGCPHPISGLAFLCGETSFDVYHCAACGEEVRIEPIHAKRLGLTASASRSGAPEVTDEDGYDVPMKIVQRTVRKCPDCGHEGVRFCVGCQRLTEEVQQAVAPPTGLRAPNGENDDRK